MLRYLLSTGKRYKEAVVAEWYTRWSQKPLGSNPVWVRLPPTAPLN